MSLLKHLASRLPRPAQQELRKWSCLRDLRRGGFRPPECDSMALPQLIKPGDYVVDVGANVGYYSLLLSKLVGPSGHVFAFEPITETCEILLFMARFAPYRNITVLQMAASDRAAMVGFDVPSSASGLPDYFRATVSAGNEFYSATLDSFAFGRKISFIKVDAEGHDDAVLRGAAKLIARDHPLILTECDESLPDGYQSTRLDGRDGRSNMLLRPVSELLFA